MCIFNIPSQTDSELLEVSEERKVEIESGIEGDEREGFECSKIEW